MTDLMINRDIIAEKLYEAYCRAVGGVAFNGDPLPKWREFSSDEKKEKQAEAWRCAADAAMDLLSP